MLTVDLRNLTCPEPVLRTKKLFEDPQVDTVQALVDDEVSVRNLERLANYLKASATSKVIDNGFQVIITRISSAKCLPGSSIAVDCHSERSEESHKLTCETLRAAQGDSSELCMQSTITEKTTVVFLSRDTFGQGDEEFSRTLLNLFLQTFFETGHKPQAILMANSGVKLMAKDSPVLKVLQDFRADGVEVAACGLCVDYYGLKDDVPVAQITNMFTICEYLAAADKVLSP